MFEIPLEDHPVDRAGDGAGVSARCRRPSPPCESRPQRVRPDDVARFVRDPVAFATSAGAVTPEAFVKAYLEGIERRLSGVVGTPAPDRPRLATLNAQTLPIGDPVERTPARRDGGRDLDRSPRMGPVLVACAVVQAVATVVAAGAAVYAALARRPAC